MKTTVTGLLSLLLPCAALAQSQDIEYRTDELDKSEEESPG